MDTTLEHSLGLKSSLAGLSRGPKLRIETRSPLARTLDKVIFWHERARQRRTLLQLEDHLIADMGLDRAEVQQEARKPFWR